MTTAQAQNVRSDERRYSLGEPDTHQLEPRFGEGPFPPELDRFNWGPVLWSWIWAATHGLWGWARLLFAFNLTVFGLSFYVSFAHIVLPLALKAIVQIAIILLHWGLTISMGVRANRIMWANQSERLASDRPLLSEKWLSISAFEASQYTWARTGFTLTVGALILTPFVIEEWLEPTRLMSTLSWPVIAVALWLWDRQRRPNQRFDPDKPRP